jgi:uncharacterized protein (TIGR00369 family)
MMTAANWDALPSMRTFGITVAASAHGYTRLDVDRAQIQLRGIRASINGGVVAALGQAAARICVESALEPGERSGAAQEITVSYLSSARGDRTVVEARLLRKGGRLAVIDAEVRDAATGVLNAKMLISWTLEREASTEPAE